MLLWLIIGRALAVTLKDGDIVMSEGISSFVFEYGYSNNDLVFSLTNFADYGAPRLFVSTSPDISDYFYNYTNPSQDEIVVSILNYELSPNTSYYLLVSCFAYCRYSISATLDKPVGLLEATPFETVINSARNLQLSFTVDETSIEGVRIVVKHTGDIKMLVNKDNEEPNESSSYPTISNWVGDLIFTYHGSKKGDVFSITLVTEDWSKINIIALSSELSVAQLQASVPEHRVISKNVFHYFKITKDLDSNNLDISLTFFSGDADIYVQFSKLPTLNNFFLCSKTQGNDYIKLRPDDFIRSSFSAGDIYIGVFGESTAAYSIIATTNTLSSVFLSPGRPIDGSVYAGELTNYLFIVSPQETKFSIFLITIQGNPDLYVKYCFEPCAVTTEDIENKTNVYTSIGSSTFQMMDFIQREGDCEAERCFYAVAVLGQESSVYSLVVAELDTSIVLQETRPFIMSAPMEGYRYFEYTITNSEASEVIFTLTPVYGNPDLYVSMVPRPTIENSEQKSERFGNEVDQVTYFKATENSLVGTYYLGVYCAQGCYYSVAVREYSTDSKSSVYLYPGHPQRDILFKENNWKLYTFFVGDSHDLPIKIVLTGFTGKFKLYVGNDKKQGTIWESESESGEPDNLITIYSTDPNYFTNSLYFIKVLAWEFYTDGSAGYLIQYSIGEDIMMLPEDTNVLGQVHSKQSNYYSFPLHFLHQDVAISVTVNSGDPDLYISLHYSNPRPSPDSYDFYSKHFGSEVITLMWESLSEQCPALRENYEHGQSQGCFLYIAVYSDYPSTYNIRLHPQVDIPKAVTSGSPIFGDLLQGGLDFFYNYATPLSPLSVILQATKGHLDLYIEIINKSALPTRVEDWKRPTEESSLKTVKSLFSTEVTMNTEEMVKHCGIACIVLISVKCNSEICEFLLDLNQEEVTVLTEKQGKYGFVANGYKYYSYFCDKDNEDLLIVVTPINSCDPSLYVAKGSEQRPTREKFTWESESSQGDSVLIKPSDKEFQGSSMKGTYIVSISSSHEACSFMLTVTNHAYPLTMLSSGVPQKGMVLSNNIKYYTYYNSIVEDLTISLTPSSGNPYLLINTHNSWEVEFYADLPTPQYYLWNSNHGADKYSITLKTTELDYCVHCYYLIGVASDNDSSYGIVLNNEFNIRVLQNGVPYKTEGAAKWEVFSFQVHNKESIFISLSEFTGHVSYYISNTFTEEKPIWSSTSTGSPITLSIDSSDPKLYIGVYYLIVTCHSTGHFYSILWHTEKVAIKLIDGWPLQLGLADTSNSQITFTFSSSNKIYCTLDTLSQEFFPEVQITFSSKSVGVDLVFNESSYVGKHLAMNFDMKSHKKLFLRVEHGVNKTSGQFSIYCTNSFHPSILRLNRLTLGSLNHDTPAMRYEVSIRDAVDLRIYLIPCSGDFSLEVSTNWTVSKQETPDLVVARLTDGILYGMLKNAIGKYYITVRKSANDKVSEFKILGDTSGLDRLYPGGEGMVEFEHNNGKVNLSWKPLEYTNHTVYNGKTRYSVYFTDKPTTQMLSTCQMHHGVSTNEARVLDTTETEEVAVKIPGKKGFVNIVAEIESHENAAIREIAYTVFEVENVRAAGRFKVIIIMASIIAALFIAVAVYYIKFRQAKEEVVEVKAKVQDGTIIDEFPMSEHPSDKYSQFK